MTGKIFRNCSLLCLAVILLSAGLFLAAMTDRFEEEVYRQMKEEASYAAHSLEKLGMDYFDGLKSQQRLTWIAADGTVLYDSVADASAMENHLDREEVRLALEQGAGQSQHMSSTLMEKTLYYAVRLSDGTVLRVASIQTPFGEVLEACLRPILGMAVLVMVFAGLLASRLARQIVRPINSLDLENPRLDGGYEELQPLVRRLREQNLTIGRQMEELRSRQREFAALMANMSEGVLMMDSRYAVLACNHSAQRLLGVEEPPESLRQDRSPKELWEAAGRALAGRRAEILLRQDSRIFEILASPVTAHGQVTGAVILMVDVTEREERDSLRREFSANVSHELKTPLTAISGFAELLKEGLVEGETVKEFAGDIYKECAQLIDLVDDILQLSRLDEGAPEVTPEEVDLYAVAGDVLESLRIPAAQRQITLRLEGERQTITGVWRILNEMLCNLCENAIKYNRDGGRVTVRVSGDETSAVVSVADTGIGIPKGQQDRVFERFYRVDKSHSRQVGGTGLGLSIVKHGAQYHNAKLTLDSEPGVGTNITITFRKET